MVRCLEDGCLEILVDDHNGHLVAAVYVEAVEASKQVGHGLQKVFRHLHSASPITSLGDSDIIGAMEKKTSLKHLKYTSIDDSSNRKFCQIL